MTLDTLLESLRDAIVRVGDGRGFLVDRSPWPHQVITAAHCLPHLPPAFPWSLTQERTYADLLGPLDEAATVWAECVFVDPIADLAVLREPDGQALPEEFESYEDFVSDRPTVQIGTVEQWSPVWLLTRGGLWESCSAQPTLGASRTLTLTDAKEGTAAGTSGSPILTTDGRAVGIVCVANLNEGHGARVQHTGQPVLTSCLPGWLLAELVASEGGAR